MLAFDIESDGLLDEITKVHCVNVIDRDDGREYRFHNDASVSPCDGDIEEGLRWLQAASAICGHNIIDYDVPAIQKVYPWFKPVGVLHDTRVYSRLIWTNLRDQDMEAIRKGRLPPDFATAAAARGSSAIGSHSLRPWGVRLGFPKDDFDPAEYGHTWATVPFSQTMSDYCAQDVRVTVKLMELIESKNYATESLELETAVAAIIRRQEARGFLFNVEEAQRLTAKLQIRRLQLEEELKPLFPPWQMPDGRPFTPKRDNRTLGYTKGVPVQKYKTVEFNPGSRDHIANRLMAVHGWKPKDFTTNGKPKVDETILAALPYPEAARLVEYMTVIKRLGQLAEGKEAWLKVVGSDGRIHGRVNTNGAVTGRMTHYQPNVAQVPSVKSIYGPECRALFYGDEVLVGCDAEGLELRMLGHFLARYDGGEFARSVVSGSKDDGTDAHSINQRLAGLNSRDSAKTLIYAFMYGAGDHKLGTIYVDDMNEAQRAKFNAAYPGGDARDAALTRLGKKLRAKFLAGLPALKRLVDDVKRAAGTRGYLKGLDGRLLHVRSQHSALNTLLQSGGALVMKRALVLLDAELQVHGLTPGVDYEFVANVHDEFQIECKEKQAEFIGRLAADAIKAAGESFRLRVELAGAYAVGRNWKETH